MPPQPVYRQGKISFRAPRRGCHLIQGKVNQVVDPLIKDISVGTCHLFIQHTSASITINENCCAEVQDDMEDALNRIAPESVNYRHSLEGPDDMPAHIKSSVFGCSTTIPISDGHLALGTWQGVWMCEHRDAPSNRKIIATVQGQVNQK